MSSWCFLHQNIKKQNISISDNLTLKVISGVSKPEFPDENTIWVNTNIGIPDGQVYFANYDNNFPTNKQEGTIYVSFEANEAGIEVKNNSFNFYILPLTVKQLISGKWIFKEAHLYTSSWQRFSIEWNGELFSKGETYNEITGGYEATIGTLETSSARVQVKNISQVGFQTKRKIDISNFTTLHMAGAASGATCYAGLLDDKGQFVVKVTIPTGSGATGAKDFTLDVSGLDGCYYFGCTGANSNNKNITLIISKAILK